MYNSQDRGDIKSLHAAASGVGATLNHKDASTSKPMWKNASPTLIRTPNSNRTNQDPAARYGRPSNSVYGGNPIKLTRMQDNLYAGNPTTKKTLLTCGLFPDTRPPKRPKIDSNSYASSSSSGQRSKDSNMSSRVSTGLHGTPKVHLSDPDIEEIERPSASSSKANSGYKRTFNDADLVVVDSDDDTDKGVVVSRSRISSPDPLVLEPSTSTNQHRRKSDHSHPSDTQAKSSRRDAIPSMAGPSKHAAVREEILYDSDSIHSFRSDDKPSRDATAGPSRSEHAAGIPPGIVQQAVQRYGGGPKVDNVPRINLIDKQKGNTLTSRMKAKPSSKGESKLDRQQDHIATSTSNFTKGQPQRNKNISNKNKVVRLPLRAWSYGMKLFTPEDDCESYPYFTYTRENYKLEISCCKPPYKTFFQLDRDVDSLIFTQDDNKPLHDPIVIQFRSTVQPRKRTEELHEDLFKAGSKGQDGKLTFNFSQDHCDWSLTSYIELIGYLKKDIKDNSTVISSGAAGIWEQVERAMELREEREIRTRSAPKTRRSSSEEAVVESVKPRPKARPTGRISLPVADDSQLLRRSTRQSVSESVRQSLSSEPDELILMYPPSGTGALNIMRTDLNRLQPGEFLNDTLIEFGLKLWLNELREKDPEFADQIHVFSSFFYKKLNRKNLEEGYQSVKKWTSKFDLFSKKYIIVPINEHMHWYLAIICDPEHTLLPPLPPTPSKTISTRRRTRQIDNVETHPLDFTSSQVPGDGDVRMEDIPRSPSRDVPDEEMKDLDLFKDSCSISSMTPDGSKPVSVSSSDAGEKLFTETSDIDIPDLNYPSPELGPRYMEIDVPEHDVINLDSKKDSPLSVISDPDTPRVDEQSEATTSNSGAVSASSFYGSASNKKGKRKASYTDVVEVIDESVDDQRQEEEVDEMLAVSSVSEKNPPVTCIFTLDSLGSRHPQALKTLKQYLKMEAKDKKNVGEYRDSFGKNALVPMQPNYCDCGVYLLHFAKTFMKDPERHCRNIREKKSSSGVERKVEWEESDVGYFRENLASRIQDLSKVWKAERAAKEEQKNKQKNKGSEQGKPSGDQNKAISSDSEVDIVEDISAPEVTPKHKQKPAARMRG